MENYEQKYKEALERAKKRFDANPTDGYVGYGNEILKEIFPELTKCDDDDEMIRKEIIEFLTYGIWSETTIDKVKQSQRYAKWITYLEKQKPVYNLEIPAGDVAPAEEDGPFDEDEFLENELSAFLQNYDKEYDDDAAISDVARHFYEIGKKQKEPELHCGSLECIECLKEEYRRGCRDTKKEQLSSPEDIAAAYQMGLAEGRKEQKPTLDDYFKATSAERRKMSMTEILEKEQKPAEIDEYEIIKKHITEDALSCEVNKRLKECGWYITDEKPIRWKPLEESMEALMLAIEGKWEAIKPTSYMSRRLEDLYDGLANTFKVECKLEE